jgi:hypothetical protein
VPAGRVRGAVRIDKKSGLWLHTANARIRLSFHSKGNLEEAYEKPTQSSREKNQNFTVQLVSSYEASAAEIAESRSLHAPFTHSARNLIVPSVAAATHSVV